MKRTLSRILIGVALAACVPLASASAVAAPTQQDRLQAQKLGREGKTLVQQGKFEEAAEKYRQADELNPAPSYKVELAKLLIGMKDLVGAGDVLRAALETNPQQWVEKQAKKQAETLLKEVNDRTPKLQISVYEPEASAVAITVDGNSFDPSAGAIDFNPGEHNVSATADGYKPFERTIELEEGLTKQLEISLQRSGGAAAAGESEVEEDSGGSGEGISPIPAYVSWGVGAAMLGVGIGFGVAAINSTNAVLEKYDCEDLECPADAEDDLNRAKLNGNVSTAGFVIGGLGIAAGTVLFFFSDAWLDGDDSDSDEGVAARPLVGPGFVGVHGTF